MDSNGLPSSVHSPQQGLRSPKRWHVTSIMSLFSFAFLSCHHLKNILIFFFSSKPLHSYWLLGLSFSAQMLALSFLSSSFVLSLWSWPSCICVHSFWFIIEMFDQFFSSLRKFCAPPAVLCCLSSCHCIVYTQTFLSHRLPQFFFQSVFGYSLPCHITTSNLYPSL